jgi:hypothetical protein
LGSGLCLSAKAQLQTSNDYLRRLTYQKLEILLNPPINWRTLIPVPPF